MKTSPKRKDLSAFLNIPLYLNLTMWKLLERFQFSRHPIGANKRRVRLARQTSLCSCRAHKRGNRVCLVWNHTKVIALVFHNTLFLWMIPAFVSNIRASLIYFSYHKLLAGCRDESLFHLMMRKFHPLNGNLLEFDDANGIINNHQDYFQLCWRLISLWKSGFCCCFGILPEIWSLLQH